jgi:ABC-type glutathione transport system ATPase component
LFLVESATLSHFFQILSIKDADFSWSKDGSEVTLEGINLSVKKGELLGLLGRVGAGKVQSNTIHWFYESYCCHSVKFIVRNLG